MSKDESFSINLTIKNMGRPFASKPVHGDVTIRCIEGTDQENTIICSESGMSCENWPENSFKIFFPDEDSIKRVGNEFLRVGKMMLKSIDEN